MATATPLFPAAALESAPPPLAIPRAIPPVTLMTPIAPTTQIAPITPITDLGEKIGGARKDTADSGFTRSRRQVDEEDTRPAWMRRFQASQIVRAGGQINAVRDEGRWVLRDLRSLDWLRQPKQVGRNTYATQAQAEEAIPLAAVSLKHRVVSGTDGRWEIWRDVTDRKRVRVVEQSFPEREQALRYMVEHAREIVEVNTTFGEADLPLPPDRKRVGPARRTDDVQGRDFMEAFGLRGVEFGNWNNQDERQALMNDAYDGLMDLAEVLGVPPQALGLDGELALGFGARGHGLNSARAHYEPERTVMNLTKERGAGSLAHEWFHALDHLLARIDGKASSAWEIADDGSRTLMVKGSGQEFVTTGFRRTGSGVPPGLQQALTAIVMQLFKRPEAYVEDMARVERFAGAVQDNLDEELQKFRRELADQKDPTYWKRFNKPASAEQLQKFDAIAARMVAGEPAALTTEWRVMPGEPGSRTKSSVKARYTNDALEQVATIYKAVRGRSGFDATNRHGVCDRLVGYMNRHQQRLKLIADAQSGTEKTRMVPTAYAMAAKELDQGRGGDYWTEPHEMAARAFQGYVEDKIAQRDGVSRFLNFAPENAAILTPWGPKRPYPSGSERVEFNAAFDRMIGEVSDLLVSRLADRSQLEQDAEENPTSEHQRCG